MDLVGVSFLNRINVYHGIQLIGTFTSHDILQSILLYLNFSSLPFCALELILTFLVMDMQLLGYGFRQN